MQEWIHTLRDVVSRLPACDKFRLFSPLENGTMKVALYAPQMIDRQTSHNQDELYIIVSGSGMIRKNDEIREFNAHDVIFVEAGVAHRFENFTDDFATGGVFWGPQGGE